jgi:SNF2 family DNA or RNA helicase
VVPASVVDSWVREWGIWAPGWRAVAWRGTPTKRHALAGTADVYVVGYDTASRDASDKDGPLLKLGPAALIVDECHMIKSQHAQRSLAVRRLAKRAKTFVALSGTPITHHPGDLWATLEGLEPLAYPSRERFVSRYCLSVQGDYKQTIIGLNGDREPEFRAALFGQHRRVAKADVLAQLPPKVYSVREVELPTAWRKAYDDMENQMLAAMPDGEELSVMSVLAQLTRLSQLASAPCDVAVTMVLGNGEEVPHYHVTMKSPSWKVNALLEVLAERPGSPVVAFAPSRQLMVLAGKAANEAGLSVGYVMGGQTQAERTQTVEHFQAGKYDVLCATTQAGGVGLTLTAAGTVVFLQRPWSLVEALQAEDRCHRIGSEIHDSIEIIDIISTDTVDSRVREVLHEKAGQLADLVQDPRIIAQLLGGSALKLKAKRKQ